MTPHLTPYFLSKWKCQQHGCYEAKTKEPVTATNPVMCPECLAGIQLEDQAPGRTSMVLPWVSRPRIPQKMRVEPTASDSRPLQKRGRSWR
jgi:hypothetical protein